MKLKIKIYILFLLTLLCFQSCKVQQTKTSLPKIENQIKGELDYAKGGLELVQWQGNGGEIIMGTIDKKGAIHFNLPELDVKEGNKGRLNNFYGQFQMQRCPGKGFSMNSKTPYDDVYYKLYAPIHVRKHGIIVAFLHPTSDKKMLIKKNNNKIIGSNYYWFSIDRDLDFKEECIEESSMGTDPGINISADIQFKKGWNFIKYNIEEVQNYGENNEQVMPKKRHITRVSPESKEVKWYLEQIADDKIIQAAKKSYNLSPMTIEQFEKWLPKKTGDFTRTSYEFGKESYNTARKNNAFLVFENGNQKMEITVIDVAQSSNALEGVNSALRASNTKVKVDEGLRYVSTLYIERKAFGIISLFDERIILEAMGYNMPEEQLWEAIKTLQIEKILK